jgi:UV DNA damage endonuclease
MRIGYACLTVGVPNTGFRTCRLKNAGEERLAELVLHNLRALERIIVYNDARDIRLFRISSDIIPFASSPGNAFSWPLRFKPELAAIGDLLKRTDMRVSMHPGQYTVLNSPDAAVYQNAAADLAYHAEFLDALGTGETSKIVLHVGGAYGDKAAALRRFAERYRDLSDAIRRRLVLENDDTTYHIGEVLELGARLSSPVVYDNLHNEANPCDPTKDDSFWIRQCAETWKEKDGRQKIHYAQQNREKRPGSHSDSILADAFLEFLDRLRETRPDIMLEVKDKNLSAVKCILCTAEKGTIKALEQEWGRYKYAVLERSPGEYQKIRTLLKDKTAYPAAAFYRAIEHAYAQPIADGNRFNAAQHVWGYFRNTANEKEKDRFSALLRLYQSGSAPADGLKRFLFRLAKKYEQAYLLDSYYFL